MQLPTWSTQLGGGSVRLIPPSLLPPYNLCSQLLPSASPLSCPFKLPLPKTKTCWSLGTVGGNGAHDINCLQYDGLRLTALVCLVQMNGLPGADEQDQEQQQTNGDASASDSAEDPAAKQDGKVKVRRANGRGGRGLQGSERRAGERKAGGSKGHSQKADQGQNQKADKEAGRGVYSFCMCPGGQIVPTTTNHDELCINGMSFRYTQYLQL